MAVQTRNLMRRALRQIDRSFWCLHAHLSTLMSLGLPMMIALGVLATTAVIIHRTWEIDPGIAFLIYGMAAPVVLLTIVTLGSLPCSVFAWHAAQHKILTPGECFSFLARRASRIIPVAIGLVFSFCLWFLFLGLPMLVYWSRSCLRPFVALFEDQKKIGKRCQQLLKDDNSFHVLALLYLLLTCSLSVLIVIPRVLVSVESLRTDFSTFIRDWIWIFELISGVILFSGMAMSWCITLTLFYHDLRYVREGEGLRKKVELLQDKYLPREFLPGEGA